MHTRGETTPPGDGTIVIPLLRRSVHALGYLAAAAFLCWRTLWINDSAEVAALPAFMLTSTAMILVVLAVRTLIRPASWDEGPS
jgi:hypothetical protein